MGSISGDEEDLAYGSVVHPPQTTQALQALLGAVHDMGFQFKASENEEVLPLRNYCEPEAPLSRPPSPFIRPETPPPMTTFDGGQVEEQRKGVLLINARLNCGLYKHTLLRTYLPSSALGAYESLLDLPEVAVSNIVSALRTMDDDEIMLATSRKPLPMDESRTYEDLMAGYTELGRLSDLDCSVQLKPVIDCEERRQLAEVHEVPQGTPIFVLYLWSDVRHFLQYSATYR